MGRICTNHFACLRVYGEGKFVDIVLMFSVKLRPPPLPVYGFSLGIDNRQLFDVLLDDAVDFRRVAPVCLDIGPGGLWDNGQDSCSCRLCKVWNQTHQTT